MATRDTLNTTSSKLAHRFSKRPYHCQMMAETFDRIREGTTPWVAIGDFLDDWRRASHEQRSALVAEPIAATDDDAKTNSPLGRALRRHCRMTLLER